MTTRPLPPFPPLALLSLIAIPFVAALFGTAPTLRQVIVCTVGMAGFKCAVLFAVGCLVAHIAAWRKGLVME